MKNPCLVDHEAKKRDQRYERFEPITVRAAVRVLQLQREGVVTVKETASYLRWLVAMDAHASEDAFPRLVRAAQRHCAGRRMAVVATQGIGRPRPCATGVAC